MRFFQQDSDRPVTFQLTWEPRDTQPPGRFGTDRLGEATAQARTLAANPDVHAVVIEWPEGWQRWDREHDGTWATIGAREY